MKNSLLTLAMLILTIQFAAAQIQIGPKAGLTGYQVASGGNNQFRFGLYTGAFLDYELNNKMNLQADIAYVEKGSRDKSRQTILNYFEISPKAKFFTNINNNNRGFYISVGFGFNFLSEAKLEQDGEVVAEIIGYDSFDLSLQLGIGWKLQNNLSIDLKMIDGGITTTKSGGTTDFRNIGANFTLAYGFDI